MVYHLSRFDTIHECDGQTDRKTDRHRPTASTALIRGKNQLQNYMPIDKVSSTKTKVEVRSRELDQQTRQIHRSW